MSKQLLEVALNYVSEMTGALEQARDKDAAGQHITKLNAIHDALLIAQRVLADNEILTARIAASKHIASASPTVLASSHAIDASVVHAMRGTAQGVSDLAKLLEETSKIAVARLASSLVAQAGKNGGFALDVQLYRRMYEIRYNVGVHNPCAGLTDLDGLIKQFEAATQRMPR